MQCHIRIRTHSKAVSFDLHDRLTHRQCVQGSHICRAHKIVVLPGDGIGPEIAQVAQKVLESAGRACGEAFEFQEELIGGAAM